MRRSAVPEGLVALGNEMKYAIWSFEHRGWWRPARFGYTSNREGAGVYEEEEAFEIVRDANKFGEINECMVPEHLLERGDVAQLFGIL